MAPVPAHTIIELTKSDLDEIIENAAQRGAQLALKNVGLSDDNAPHDVRDLRDLLKAFRDAKSTAWQTFIKIFTTAILSLLVLGAAWQAGLNKLLSGS